MLGMEIRLVCLFVLIQQLACMDCSLANMTLNLVCRNHMMSVEQTYQRTLSVLCVLQLVSSFQQEALTKQQESDTMWSKLSNVRRMIAKLLKTMNDVRNLCNILCICNSTGQ